MNTGDLMKTKYIILILAVMLLGGCSVKPVDYISVGYDSVSALKAKTEILSTEMIIDKDNKIEDFECKYPCVKYAFRCSFKEDGKVISDYNELTKWFSQTCTEEYAQRIFDEIALINYNNEIYYTAVDMLLDLYDYDSSKIVSYETDGDTVTYTCEASGSDGGGEPMELLTYTFSLVNDNGNWKFADCSYNGFCNYRLLCDTLTENN